jgi:hypothetical protein
MANADSTVAALNAPERRGTAHQDTRRERALTSATHQLEAIFNMMIFIVRQERDDAEEWSNFDSECLPEITRALAIRGRDLNGVMMAALVKQVSIEDLEGLVFRGERYEP